MPRRPLSYVLAGLAAALIRRLVLIGRLGNGDGAIGAVFVLSFLLGVVLIFSYGASLIGNFSGRGLPVLGRSAARLGGYFLAIALGLAIAQAFPVFGQSAASAVPAERPADVPASESCRRFVGVGWLR